MQGDLRVSLLLQVADDALPDEITAPDDLQDLVVVLSHEGQLEAVLGRVDGDCSWLGSAVETMDHLALDASEVYRLIEGFDDAVITGIISFASPARLIDSPLWQSVFDVVQGSVDKYPTVIPRSRLYPDGLVDERCLSK